MKMLPYTQPPNLKEEVAEIVRLWDEPKQKRYTRKRMEALGSFAVEELIRLIGEETVKRKRFFKFYFVALVCNCLYWLIIHFIAWFSHNPAYWYKAVFHLNNLLLMSVLYKWSPKGKAGQVLAEQDDIRIVGALAEARSFPIAQEAVTQALIRLLPRMKASDAHLLNAEQKKALYTGLASTEEALILTILKSLEQIGDGSALPYVEKLAYPSEKAKVSEEVQEAARACLPFLTERAAEEQNRSTLLRASDGITTQPGELLRPAAATEETDPKLLLRATQQE
jgi:hypothetical protein